MHLATETGSCTLIMAKVLRRGLVEPSTVSKRDLPDYMGDTYRGYMTAIKQRMAVVRDNEDIDFGFVEINKEFFALQLRMIFELVAFAVITFHQREIPLAKSRRTINGALDALKLIPNYSWIISIDHDFDIENAGASIDFPTRKTDFTDKDFFKKVHGRLGDLLHEQQRPRPTNEHKYSIQKLLEFRDSLSSTLTKHMIIDSSGAGWYVNLNCPKQPNGVMIMKLRSEEKPA